MTLALTVLALFTAVPDDNTCLVALYPATWNDRAALIEQGTTVLLNLDDCVLALAPADALPRSMPARVLEHAAGNTYYYVHLRRPVSLDQYGRTVFAAGDDYVLAVTPATEPRLEASGLEHHRLAPVLIQRLPSAAAAPTAAVADPAIEEMVSKVDSARYLGYVRRMQNFQTRYDPTDSCQAAAEFLFAVYDSLGLSPSYHKYRIDLPPNVIATRTGSVEPDIQVIVCGHFDSIVFPTTDALTFAPGADDNASGAIAALEIGRVMAEYNFRRTVKFIDFSGEELGLYGSIAYADSVGTTNPRDSILGVIDLDMIGYMNGTHNTVTVVHNPPSAPLADSFVTATTTYVPGLTARKVVDLSADSDHAPFWDNGYQAFCGIDLNSFDPNWHEQSDTIGTGSGCGFNALGYATKIVKASLATLAMYAGPIPIGPSAPTNLTATVVSETEVRLNWKDNATDEQGYAIERRDLVQGWQVLDSVPANMVTFYDRTVYPGTPYTYRVRAYNANGFSAYSNEATVMTGAVAEQPPPTPRLALTVPPVFTGDLVVRYTRATAAPATLRVCDVTGRTVGEQLLSGTNPTGTVSFTSRALPAGVYFVELGQGGRCARSRVVRL